MNEKPYPGHPPNLVGIHRSGNYYRTCLVVELLTQDRLTDVELSQVQEYIEAILDNKCKAVVDKYDVVQPGRFDRMLLEGLRLLP